MRRFLELLTQFLELLSPSTFGVRMIEAARAFETPPTSSTARRYGVVAVCSLLAGALLLVAAAMVDSIVSSRPLSEGLGWAGIVCLIFCALRYKVANESFAESQPTERVRQAGMDHDSQGEAR